MLPICLGGPEDVLQDQGYPYAEPDEADFVVDDERNEDPMMLALMSGESDSASEDEEDNFDFNHHSLNRILDFRQIRTAKASPFITRALSVPHRQDYECKCRINTLKSKNLFFVQKVFPHLKKKCGRFWEGTILE